MDLLTGPYWLNSDVISFYFHHLQTVTFRNAEKLIFIQPILTQLVKAGTGSASSYLDPLNVASKDLLLFALNNHMGSNEGGLHWSLVAYSRSDNAFYSFDSKGTFNLDSAKLLVKELAVALRCPAARLIQVRCRQQGNGYDCGVWVIAHAEQVGLYFLAHGTLRNIPQLEADLAKLKRREVLDLVTELSIRQLSSAQPPSSKKGRKFLMLQDFHGGAAPKFAQENGKSPSQNLFNAASELTTKIAKADRVSTDPRAFGVAPELVLESIVMRINNRMLPEAIDAGNVLTGEMLNPVHIQDSQPGAKYKDCFYVSEFSVLLSPKFDFLLHFS